ncbi:MAG: TRAP transporter large permease subunit [Rhizobiaceae bacterium]
MMGEILLQTGVAFQAIGPIDRMISRLPGRLSIVAVVGRTVFSSLSSSTIANTAILGSVLLPDMVKRGYSPAISMGPIMAVGGIAMLVSPSELAVLLASMAEQSISNLLIAGIIPGILMATLFFLYVIGGVFWPRPLRQPISRMKINLMSRLQWIWSGETKSGVLTNTMAARADWSIYCCHSYYISSLLELFLSSWLAVYFSKLPPLPRLRLWVALPHFLLAMFFVASAV